MFVNLVVLLVLELFGLLFIIIKKIEVNYKYKENRMIKIFILEIDIKSRCKKILWKKKLVEKLILKGYGYEFY